MQYDLCPIRQAVHRIDQLLHLKMCRQDRLLTLDCRLDVILLVPNAFVGNIRFSFFMQMQMIIKRQIREVPQVV